jgi:hypothetical protein
LAGHRSESATERKPRRPVGRGRAGRLMVVAVTSAFVLGVVLLRFVAGATAVTNEAGRLSAGNACATPSGPVPAALVPPDVRAWAQNAPVLGRGRIWTVVSALEVPAEFGSGIWALKFSWYLHPATGGVPALSARRLDGSGHFRGIAEVAHGGPAPIWVARARPRPPQRPQRRPFVLFATSMPP